MTIRSETRDLARWLLTHEAMSAKSSELLESPTNRVYEKLRQSLSEFAGVAAFQSLAFRALTQAKSEAPSLWAARIAEDGSLTGLGEFETQIDTDKDPVGDGGVVLIARLLGLLLVFLGEALTLGLLRVTWPGAVLRKPAQVTDLAASEHVADVFLICDQNSLKMHRFSGGFAVLRGRLPASRHTTPSAGPTAGDVGTDSPARNRRTADCDSYECPGI